MPKKPKPKKAPKQQPPDRMVRSFPFRAYPLDAADLCHCEEDVRVWSDETGACDVCGKFQQSLGTVLEQLKLARSYRNAQVEVSNKHSATVAAILNSIPGVPERNAEAQRLTKEINAGYAEIKARRKLAREEVDVEDLREHIEARKRQRKKVFAQLSDLRKNYKDYPHIVSALDAVNTPDSPEVLILAEEINQLTKVMAEDVAARKLIAIDPSKVKKDPELEELCKQKKRQRDSLRSKRVEDVAFWDLQHRERRMALYKDPRWSSLGGNTKQFICRANQDDNTVVSQAEAMTSVFDSIRMIEEREPLVGSILAGFDSSGLVVEVPNALPNKRGRKKPHVRLLDLPEVRNVANERHKDRFASGTSGRLGLSKHKLLQLRFDTQAWSSFEIVWAPHRCGSPLPLDSEITHVRLCRTKVGAKYRYKIIFTANFPRPPLNFAAVLHTAAYDIGWREMPDGSFRLGSVTHKGTHVEVDDIEIPPWVFTTEPPDRSKDRIKIVKALEAWAEDFQLPWLTDCVATILDEATRYNFRKLYRKWKHEISGSEAAVTTDAFQQFEQWWFLDSKNYSTQAHQYERRHNRMKDMFRKLANRIIRRRPGEPLFIEGPHNGHLTKGPTKADPITVSRLVLEGVDGSPMLLSSFKLIPKTENAPRAKGHKQRSNMQKCSPGLFRQVLIDVATREGVEVVLVAPQNTSRTCPWCKHINAKTSQLLITCENCGRTRDRDHGAGLVMIEQADLQPSKRERSLETPLAEDEEEAA